MDNLLGLLLLPLRPTPLIQPPPMLHQIIKVGHALHKLAVGRPAKALVQNKIRIGKDLGVKEPRRGLAEEPLVGGEQHGERVQGVGGVGEELCGRDGGAAGGLEDLGGGGGAEGVQRGELQERRGGEIERCEEGGVGGVEVERVELWTLAKGVRRRGYRRDVGHTHAGRRLCERRDS